MRYSQMQSFTLWTCKWSFHSIRCILIAPADMCLEFQRQDSPAGASQAQNYRDRTSNGKRCALYLTLDAIKKIMEDEGFTGLYSGIHGSLIGVASTNFAYFYWYSVIRTLYLSMQKLPKPPSTAIELSLGATAGAVAQVFTIPVSVVTTRQQTQPKGDKKGLFDTGREVVNSEDGVSGLWRGLKASLVLVVNPAITYGAYQRLRDLIFPGKSNLRPWEAFGERNVNPYPTNILNES